MKALVLALALIPSLVFAESAGIRVAATAKMEILSATGIYQGVKEVTLASIEQNGNRLAGYLLIIDGEPMNFKITKPGRNTGCGTKHEAVHKEAVSVPANTVLLMNDMSNAMCMRVVAHTWEVTIETRPFHASQVSTLILGGNPKALADNL